MQDTLTLPVVTYQNCRDNTPRQSYRRWDNLSAGLTRHLARSDKDGPAWSPTEYVPDRPRGNANVQSVSCYVADIDDGTTAAALWDGWRTPDGRPLAWCLHSSYSSTPEQPKYRVVFPLKAPVPAAEWPAVHRKLTLALVGDHADPSCKDAARLYFLPSCPPGALETAFADAQEGEPLDPADFPDPDPADAAESQMRRAFRDGPPHLVGADGAGGGKPGDDFNARGDALALLLSHGWQEAGERGGLTLLRRPGKTQDNSATFGFGGNPIFYCFTSSAPPFEANRGYNPFGVYALLEHGGDFTAAARQLAKEGYGEPRRPAMRPSVSTGKTITPEKTTADDDDALPLPVVEWPMADVAMFHGLAGDIVHMIEPHTEADSVALLVQILVAFGSCIGRAAHFRAEADLHYGNLYAVLVGVSSKGRKGTSWGYVRRLFKDADLDWAGQRIASGLSSGEGLIWNVRDPIEKQVKNKKTGEYETEIEDHGVSDKRLLVQEGEFAGVLKVMGREGSTLSPIMRNGWDTGSLQSLTKNSPARSTGAHISVVGHVTADELRRELSSTEAGNGFGNRFLWFCVRRSKELPEGGNMGDGALSPFVSRLRAALENAKKAGEMKRDEEARAVWLAVYSGLSAAQPGLFGAVTGRGEAQTMRLALLYALLDGAECIRREHLTAALALWEYVEASARYVFGDSMGDPVADDILRALQRAPEGMSRNDIRELFQRHQSSGRIGQAIALLLKHGRARVSQEQTGGRPTERWFAVGTGEKSQEETAP